MAMVTIKLLAQAGKKRLSYIPTLCTLVNALFGFLAVIKALEGDFLSAAYCIVSAAIMDMIDGRVARFFGLTSAFGMELDSLCDAVSFCFVPAIVMYCWCLHTQGLLGIIVLALYLWCGLFRLARFNLSAAVDTRYFTGLPTTFSALCVASLLVYRPSLDAGSAHAAWHCWASMVVISLLAVLMVSRVRFPACKHMQGRLFRKLMLGGLCVLVFLALYKVGLIVVLPAAYILLSSAVDIYYRVRRAYRA